MLLTRDNVLRFVRQQKYVTPTHVAKEFDVVTTIASAALSELVKDKSLKLTHIKFGTTPYYYDPLQKECLIEIAKKSFSGNELALFEKIEEQQILSKNSMTIPEQVIVNRLKDIMYEIIIEHQNKEYIFYIWYLRDKKETISQIKTALKGDSNSIKTEKKVVSNEKKSNLEPKKEIPEQNSNGSESLFSKNSLPSTSKKEDISSNPFENIYSKKEAQKGEEKQSTKLNSNDSSNSVVEIHSSLSGVDSYLHKNGFKILEKEKHALGSIYRSQIMLKEFNLRVDCISIEQKKVNIKELMDFYTSSMCPKYIFYVNIPKKIETVFEELDNCFLVKLKEL